MKMGLLGVGIFAIALAGCSTTPTAPKPVSMEEAPEPVMVTYYPKAGADSVLIKAISHAWEVYRKEHVVFEEPHVLVRGEDKDGNTRLVEIFTWATHAAPEHASAAVQSVWAQEQSLCEGKNGHRGIEGGEVNMIIPAQK
ncbi:MAG TPA: hypothetical protein VHH88_08960 [Verrucomicrobiae bacterium]|nr:hypothetical protein [Verrucomicrobiae bacterium]